MKKFAGYGIGLVMAAFAGSAFSAPVAGQAPAAMSAWTQSGKTAAVAKGVNARVKAAQDTKPCPYRRS